MQARFVQRFLRAAVALQLDVEAVAEQFVQLAETGQRLSLEAVGEPGIDGALGATGEADDAAQIVAVEPAELGGDAPVLAFEVGLADQPREVAEAGRHLWR